MESKNWGGMNVYSGIISIRIMKNQIFLIVNYKYDIRRIHISSMAIKSILR